MFDDDTNTGWALPLAVLGVGGVGLLMLSDRGMKVLGKLVGRLREAPMRFQQWNEAAQRELDRIQATLDELAEALEVPPS